MKVVTDVVVTQSAQQWVLVEYFGDASNRKPVRECGVLTMSSQEAAEMNRRLVLTPCRVLLASWFKETSEWENGARTES